MVPFTNRAFLLPFFPLGDLEKGDLLESGHKENFFPRGKNFLEEGETPRTSVQIS